MAVTVATRAQLSHRTAEVPQSTIAKPRLPPRPPRPQLRAKPRTQSPRSSLRVLTARALPVSMDTLPAVLLELTPPPPRFSTEAGGGRAGFLPRLAPRFHSGKQTRRVGRRTCGKTIT